MASEERKRTAPSELRCKQADREDRRAALAARRAVRLLRGGKLKMSARDAARRTSESISLFTTGAESPVAVSR